MTGGSLHRVERPLIGVAERVTPTDTNRAGTLLTDLDRLGIRHVRAIFESTADNAKGTARYVRLLKRMAEKAELLPSCPVLFSKGALAENHSFKKHISWYTDIIDQLRNYSDTMPKWVDFSLWFDERNLSVWEDTAAFDSGAADLADALYRLHELGVRSVLSASQSCIFRWLGWLCERGAAGLFDAVGLRYYPQYGKGENESWDRIISSIRCYVDTLHVRSEIWITETGCSTDKYRENDQLGELVRLSTAPVTRAYWYSMYDGDQEYVRPHVDMEERFGLKRMDGSPKLLYRVWSGWGIGGVSTLAALGNGSNVSWYTGHIAAGRRRNIQQSDPVHLITGGAGFIGTNLAARLLSEGERVHVIDNLSRPGVEQNLRWLKETYGSRLSVEIADIRDRKVLCKSVRRAKSVFHFAAQVAVTSSLDDPVDDFEVNAYGTLSLLEALRGLDHSPGMVFTSTNKVYGRLDDIALKLRTSRYEPVNPELRRNGIGEFRPLDFHSPYGCSKGAADQYVSDYARVYGLPAVVFRMSCIYGPHQFGTEDQGWVAHFLIRALRGESITLYGDGYQVRDILFVEDLVAAFLLALNNMSSLSGGAFNIGGGPTNVVSLRELLNLIERLNGSLPDVRYGDWRTGDQRYYVSDTHRFSAATGWKAATDVHTGVERLYSWLAGNLGKRSSETRMHIEEPESVFLMEGA